MRPVSCRPGDGRFARGTAMGPSATVVRCSRAQNLAPRFGRRGPRNDTRQKHVAGRERTRERHDIGVGVCSLGRGRTRISDARSTNASRATSCLNALQKSLPAVSKLAGSLGASATDPRTPPPSQTPPRGTPPRRRRAAPPSCRGRAAGTAYRQATIPGRRPARQSTRRRAGRRRYTPPPRHPRRPPPRQTRRASGGSRRTWPSRTRRAFASGGT